MTPRLTSLLAAAIVAAALPLTACQNGEVVGGVDAWNGTAFSAEMFDSAHADKPMSRIYLGGGRVRLQSMDSTSIGAIVVDPSHGTTLIVNDPAKAYIDAGMFTPLVTIAFAPLMRVLRPAGAGDPCSQWNSAVNPFGAFAKSDKNRPVQQWTCTSQGSDNVSGRPAHKWGVTSNDPADGPMTVWIDDKLHVMSRSVDKDGGMEMRNISEGPQPDSLFTPPANYKKLTISSILGGMMGGSKDGQTGGASTDFLKKLQGATAH
jgi:hypothetical protein